MMPPSYSTPAPEVPRRTRISTTELTDQLWETVLTSVGPLEIRAGCEQQLREIIAQGAKRMALERRTAPDDIGMAEQNLERLIGLMKHNAELLGHPQWLGEDTLLSADSALRLMRFELWPFWPWTTS
jgi:hypothetical protein